MRPFTLCLATVTLLTALAGSAAAQTVSVTKPVIAKPLKSTVIVRSDRLSAEDVGPIGGRKEVETQLRSPNAKRGVLSRFKLNFIASDHRISTMGILVDDSRATMRFFDMDANDSFRGTARWYHADTFGTTQTVSARAAGDVSITLPPGPEGHVALLQGFQFQRKQGTDANVRLVAVQIAEDSRSVRVALVDDQGADFRGIEGATTFGLAALPIGALIVPPLFGAKLTGTMPEFDERRLRTFEVTVQYVWVPARVIAGNGLVSGTTRMADSGRLPGPNDKVGLRGFRFFFGNSDHFLRGIGVDLTGDPRQPPIVYQDNGLDDPVSWSVSYATLR